MNVVELPTKDIGDIPRGLRAIADAIEAGEYGDAHNLAWVIDCGNYRIEIGMLGHAAMAGAEGAYLFALAHTKLILAGLETPPR